MPGRVPVLTQAVGCRELEQPRFVVFQVNGCQPRHGLKREPVLTAGVHGRLLDLGHGGTPVASDAQGEILGAEQGQGVVSRELTVADDKRCLFPAVYGLKVSGEPACQVGEDRDPAVVDQGCACCGQAAMD